MKCGDCLHVKEETGNKVPVGWLPFAWGPNGEEPLHFYVFPEDTPEPDNDTIQELDVVKLCEVPDPVQRI